MIMEEKCLPVYGDGSSERDYTFVDDIIDGVYRAILYNKTKFEVFNLGNNKTVTLSQLIKNIECGLGKAAKIDRKPKQLGDVDITYANITKGKTLLSYLPKTEIRKGLSEFIRWFKGNNDMEETI